MLYRYGNDVGPILASPYGQAQIVPIWDPDGLSHYDFCHIKSALMVQVRFIVKGQFSFLKTRIEKHQILYFCQWYTNMGTIWVPMLASPYGLAYMGPMWVPYGQAHGQAQITPIWDPDGLSHYGFCHIKSALMVQVRFIV